MDYDVLAGSYLSATAVCDPIDYLMRQRNLLYAVAQYLMIRDKPQEEEEMDKQIRKIEKKEKAVVKDLKHLEKADKKRDKLVDAGQKAKKMKGKC